MPNKEYYDRLTASLKKLETDLIDPSRCYDLSYYGEHLIRMKHYTYELHRAIHFARRRINESDKDRPEQFIAYPILNILKKEIEKYNIRVYQAPLHILSYSDDLDKIVLDNIKDIEECIKRVDAEDPNLSIADIEQNIDEYLCSWMNTISTEHKKLPEGWQNF